MLKKRNAQQSYIKRYLILGFGLLAVALAVQSAAIFWLHKQVQLHSTDKIERLILQSVDSLQWRLAVDAQTGRQYVPAARLAFPADTIQNPLLASYIPYQEDGQEPVLQFNTQYVMNAAKSRMVSVENFEEKFADVPKLQACTRHVSLTFDDKAEKAARDPIKVGTKTLADGRTIYLFQDRACGRDANRLIAFLKQVESY